MLETIESWLLNPYLAIALALVLTVVGVRVTDNTAGAVLLIAWALFVLSFFRVPAIARQSMAPRLLIVAILGGVAGLSLLRLHGWRPTPAPAPLAPVTIAPMGDFQLCSGQWSRTTSVTVTNNTPRILFAVYVKVWTESPGVASEKIRITMAQEDLNAPELTIISPDGKMAEIISTDAFMMDFIDANSRETVHIRFHRLSPGEGRTFFVSGDAAVNSVARVEVLTYRTDEEPVSGQQNRAAIPYVAPESGTPKHPRYKSRMKAL